MSDASNADVPQKAEQIKRRIEQERDRWLYEVRFQASLRAFLEQQEEPSR